MENISGVVEAVRKDGKGFKLDNGDWYSSLNPSDIACRKGDSVQFSYTTTSKAGRTYNNVRGKVEVLGSGVASTGMGDGPAPRGPSNLLPVMLERGRAIIRQNALTSAVAYVGHNEAGTSVERTIEVARIFESYTSGDMDIVEAAQEQENDPDDFRSREVEFDPAPKPLLAESLAARLDGLATKRAS